ncbi:MAG: hypothetical protein KJ072_21700 [Verrucomicrobia bacterium]|nr:hypothetical protein [Verrucomicrobiota bacterium]
MNEAVIEMPATGVLLGLVIAMGIYWVVYSLVLFTLMKFQGWHVGPVALLGSTALATALAQVPLVGPYLGTAVLAVCIWKASGSDFIDSVFSVVIAGAIMFAFQIFALTALMGQLGLDRFNQAAVDPDDIVEVAATEVWAPSGKEPMLYLKGITLSTNGNMVLVGSGSAHQSFTNGEIAAIDSPEGRLIVRCEQIMSNEVIMHVEWKDRQYRIPLLPSAALKSYP